MTIEEAVFKKYRPNFTKLPAVGFTRRQHDYQFEQDFLDGQFHAVVRVRDDGTVSGNVIDNSTGEEYLPLRTVHCGPFAATVKAAYVDLLHTIAHRCFVSQPFRGAQANRIAAQVATTFHDQPEFIFKKLPDYAAFRDPQSQKWYGLVMDIPRAKLTNKATGSDQDQVEVLDLRCTPDQQPRLLQHNGVYPGYHLNRKNWLCVTLDDTLPDADIMRLIRASRRILTKPRSWLVPANPKYYDIMHAFADQDTIIWKQAAKIRVGDTVFLYVTAPVKAIVYQCRVVENDLPYNYTSPQLRIKRIMRIQLVKQYDPHVFTLPVLKKYGITTIRGPRHLPADLLQQLKR